MRVWSDYRKPGTLEHHELGVVVQLTGVVAVSVVAFCLDIEENPTCPWGGRAGFPGITDG